jgi:hypothetical protein
VPATPKRQAGTDAVKVDFHLKSGKASVDLIASPIRMKVSGTENLRRAESAAPIFSAAMTDSFFSLGPGT